MFFRFSILILTLVVTGCGTGVSTEKKPEQLTNSAGAPLAVQYNDLSAFVSDSKFADKLSGCAALDIDLFKDEYSCSLSELSFIGQETSSPTVDDIMSRVVVSHPWMGERFRDALEMLPSDVRLLFRSITAVVIDADVRPAYYWGGTAAIYLDPAYLWTTNEEKATISQDEDFRAGFGDELAFVDAWRYTLNNDYAIESFSLTGDEERSVEQMSLSLVRLLYHELAHANDFMPSDSIAGLSTDQSALQALESVAEDWVSNLLYNDNPLSNQVMLELADTLFRTGEATDAQKLLSGADVGGFHEAEGAANHTYAYSTNREDVAMMFEAMMMKRNYQIDMDVAYLEKPATDNPGCNDYKIGWGKRNLIASPVVRPRASFVVSKILPDLDWIPFIQSLTTPDTMTVGDGWCDSLVTGAPSNSNARLVTEKAAAGNHWQDLRPRIH